MDFKEHSQILLCKEHYFQGKSTYVVTVTPLIYNVLYGSYIFFKLLALTYHEHHVPSYNKINDDWLHLKPPLQGSGSSHMSQCTKGQTLPITIIFFVRVPDYEHISNVTSFHIYHIQATAERTHNCSLSLKNIANFLPGT